MVVKRCVLARVTERGGEGLGAGFAGQRGGRWASDSESSSSSSSDSRRVRIASGSSSVWVIALSNGRVLLVVGGDMFDTVDTIRSRFLSSNTMRIYSELVDPV